MAESDQGTTSGRPTAGAAQPRRPFIPREERDRRRREALESLTVGEWREGRVTSVVPFGAFVDLGGIDGLVHISQLGTGGYVEMAEDVVQPGVTVRVRVVEIDRERGRVGLSMREPAAPRPQRAPQPERSAPTASPVTPPQTQFVEPGGNFGDAPPRGGGGRRPDRSSRNNREQFRSEQRPRSRRRDEDSEDWHVARGGAARDYYAIFGDEPDDEQPAPTTAEELVARFNRDRQ